MENLSIKLIKGHKYLYITDVFKVNSKSKKVTFYIGNIEKINENEFILKLREFNEFRLTKIIEIAQNLYHSPYLSGENIAYLEKLRVLFSRFRILYPDETDRYRTNMYTRYVQGTVAIEGNTISPIEAGLLLNKGISPDGKRVDEIYEIMNFLHLQNYLHEYQEEISERLIRRIHAIIMENLMHTPGDYRNLDVQIEKVEYLPPPSFEVPHMMQDLIKWYKQNKNNILIKQREYYQINKIYIAERSSIYAKNNRPALNALSKKRKLSIKKCIPLWANLIQIKTILPVSQYHS